MRSFIIQKLVVILPSLSNYFYLFYTRVASILYTCTILFYIFLSNSLSNSL